MNGTNGKRQERFFFREYISEKSPLYVTFIVDQSEEMSDPWSHDLHRSRAAVAADQADRSLASLLVPCVRGSAIRDLVFCSAFLYGGAVQPVFSSYGTGPVPVGWYGKNPLYIRDTLIRQPDGPHEAGHRRVRLPHWISPRAEGRPAIEEALRITRKNLLDWKASHGTDPSCIPPVVIIILGGPPLEASFAASVRRIQAISFHAGTVRVFISYLPKTPSRPYRFPEKALPDPRSGNVTKNPVVSTFSIDPTLVAAMTGMTGPYVPEDPYAATLRNLISPLYPLCEEWCTRDTRAPERTVFGFANHSDLEGLWDLFPWSS